MRDLATHQILEEQYGRPTFLQALAVATAAVPVRSAAITPGSRLLIQPTVAGALKIGDSTVTVTTDGVILSAAEKFYVCLKMTDTNISFMPASSVVGAVCNIFLME